MDKYNNIINNAINALKSPRTITVSAEDCKEVSKSVGKTYTGGKVIALDPTKENHIHESIQVSLLFFGGKESYWDLYILYRDHTVFTAQGDLKNNMTTTFIEKESIDNWQADLTVLCNKTNA